MPGVVKKRAERVFEAEWQPKTEVAPVPRQKQPEMLLQLQLTISVYIARGQVSGRSYRFEGALSTAWVDERDASELLARVRQEGGCCGQPAIEKKVFLRLV